MRTLATPEPNEHPDFCTLAKKVFCHPDLRLDVVVGHHRAESYVFLFTGTPRDFAGLALLFTLDKFEATVIQEPAYRWILVGPDLNKVETFVLRHLEGVTQLHHDRLGRILATNYPNLIGSNSAIHPEFFCYVCTPCDTGRTPAELRFDKSGQIGRFARTYFQCQFDRTSNIPTP
jgi:hypothetical protein